MACSTAPRIWLRAEPVKLDLAGVVVDPREPLVRDGADALDVDVAQVRHGRKIAQDLSRSRRGEGVGVMSGVMNRLRGAPRAAVPADGHRRVASVIRHRSCLHRRYLVRSLITLDRTCGMILVCRPGVGVRRMT